MKGGADHGPQQTHIWAGYENTTWFSCVIKTFSSSHLFSQFLFSQDGLGEQGASL